MEDRQPERASRGDLEQDASEAFSPPVVYDPARNQPGFFQRLVYLFRPQASANMRENLQDALASQQGGDQTFSPEERAMLHNILRLREIRVEDVMIPRADIEAIDIKSTIGDLLQLFQTSGHSRMPVYSETLDDPRGMVHIRDVMAWIAKTGKRKPRARRKSAVDATVSTTTVPNATVDLGRIDLSKTMEEAKLTREVLFVPASMLASDLMARMQANRIQMALVIDEYGGTDGLVSLEDIVEMVVGDIEDEHDEVELGIEDKGDGVFVMDARVELEDLGKHLGPQFLAAVEAEDEDVDSIGGLIFALLGRIPVRGEVIPAFGGCEIEVLDADLRRIRRVRVARSRQAMRKRQPRKEAKSEPPKDGEILPPAKN